jgi:hypothetical protein
MKKKLENGFITSIRVEKSIRDMCDAMDISLGDAFSAGADILIQHYIKKGRMGKATQDMMKDYFAYQARHMDEMRDIVRSFDERQKKLDELENAVGEKEEMIMVWDSDEEQKVKMPARKARRLGLA